MMALLSFGWWAQRLSGVAAQAIYIVAGIAVLIGGLAWLRHDAVLQERAKAAVQMEKARTAQLLVLRRRERDALAVGARAEQDLIRENDLAAKENEALLKRIREMPTSCNGIRPVCYPKEIVGDLNR